MARCPAAKRRDEAVTGSQPFSSKASYRYPRKKTSSGRAAGIAVREVQEGGKKEQGRARRVGWEQRERGGIAGGKPQDKDDPGEQEDGGDGERSGWTHGRKFPLYPIGRIRYNSSGTLAKDKPGGGVAHTSAPGPEVTP